MIFRIKTGWETINEVSYITNSLVASHSEAGPLSSLPHFWTFRARKGHPRRAPSASSLPDVLTLSLQNSPQMPSHGVGNSYGWQVWWPIQPLETSWKPYPSLWSHFTDEEAGALRRAHTSTNRRLGVFEPICAEFPKLYFFFQESTVV